MDTRRWGPGERLVFEPYSKDVFEQAFNWIADREIFAKDQMGAGRYRIRHLVAGRKLSALPTGYVASSGGM